MDALDIVYCAPLSLDVDALRLDGDLRRLADGWLTHFAEGVYEGGWDVLPLMSAGGSDEDVTTSLGDDFAPTRYLKECPYFQELLASFRCPLLRVKLHRLEPGARIKTHVDPLYDCPELARIHVPIVTSPDVEFVIADRRLDLQPGRAWFTEVAFPHSVAHRGDRSRIHLVIDCLCNDWLEEVLGFPLREVRRVHRDAYDRMRRKYERIGRDTLRARTARALRMVLTDPRAFAAALRAEVRSRLGGAG